MTTGRSPALPRQLETGRTLDLGAERRFRPAVAPDQTAPTPAPEPEPAAPEAADRGGVDFDELVDLLKKEIDDLPAMTALAVFGLGLVTGKLLSE